MPGEGPTREECGYSCEFLPRTFHALCFESFPEFHSRRFDKLMKKHGGKQDRGRRKQEHPYGRFGRGCRRLPAEKQEHPGDDDRPVNEIKGIRNLSETLQPGMQKKAAQCAERPPEEARPLDEDASKSEAPGREGDRVPGKQYGARQKGRDRDGKFRGTSGGCIGEMGVQVEASDAYQEERKLGGQE